jgi:eukaryotic-like serine/threonine-protein kinase
METSEPGSALGDRYETVRRIARGGGGTVWLAHDRVLAREVALKDVTIPDELPEDDRRFAKERVLREAKAAARLGHPGVVTVYDVLDGGDTVHLVMELVQAPTLRELVATEGPLDDAEAARVGVALLEVLQAAHDRGIVHRDLKPSNVFVHANGTVQLADFGIASIAGETSLTITGTALGSPDYIAPEQAQGDPAAPAADLWGLGVTLYHAVEGVPPFERAGLIPTVQAVINDAPRPFQNADGLRDVIGALLRKDPDERPSADEVRSWLSSVAAGGEGPAPRSESTTQAIPLPTDPITSGGEPTPALAEQPASAHHDQPASAHDEQPAVPDPEPEPAPPPDEPDEVARSGRGRRPVVIAAAVVALLAIAGVATLLGGDPADDEVAEAPGDEEQAAGEDAEPEPEDAGGDEDPAEDVQPDDGPTPVDEADEVPDDWQAMEGATYQVAVPAGWEERGASGNRTDYVDPDSGAYLRVDHTDDPAPDPLADWETAAADFSQRHDGYEEVRLEPVTYRDYDAAIWEYRYSDGGADLRAVNLNIVDGDHAYALNLQSEESDWDEVGGLLPAITAGFQPDR